MSDDDAVPSRTARGDGTSSRAPGADAAYSPPVDRGDDPDDNAADANVDADADADPDADVALSPSRDRSESRRRRKKRSRKKRNPGLAKKLFFITHLLKTLDLVVFAELSALYYMECSMFRFLLRAAGQYTYLTPKDDSFPFFLPSGRVHVLLVLIPNLICMALHMFGHLPRGPGFHRGYQHGGLIIDFVGQRPPTYRLYYVLADVVILAVQCLMLTVHTQREKLRVALKTFRPLVPDIAQELATARSAEDLDAEERGVLQNAPGMDMDVEDDDVELQPLSSNMQEGEGSAQMEGSGSLVRPVTSEASSRSQMSDIINSGNAVLGEYHIIRSLASAAEQSRSIVANSLQTMGYGATVAALRARRQGAAAQAATLHPNR
ncbi:ferric reductase transmembrane component [Purpureocillium lavendulum]|uniref:Ferric reductase transmembrane component n=1 Tax=Purpureocillium lavendulum TaxID=1247861 RepID=A0AB34G3I0_9HYPO|nr:ferric reductase transmembrane component [Purpureocillium lavendulum]